VRIPLSLFAVAALVVAGGDPVVAQKEGGKGKDLPPQNELLSKFADNPESFKGKTVTFEGMYINGVGTDRLRDRVGDDGIPIQVYSPNRKAKLYLGLMIPKGFPPAEVPNAGDRETVIVTFVCTAGKTDRGNKAIAIRRPE
jgi:hypothetical protein